MHHCLFTLFPISNPWQGVSDPTMHMLSDESVEVLQEKRRMLMRRMTATEKDLKGDLVWKKEHKAIRASKDMNCPAAPDHTRLLQEAYEAELKLDCEETVFSPQLRSLPWPALYSLREQDISILSDAAASRLLLVGWDAPHDGTGEGGFFDITEPASHSRIIAKDLCPPLLRHHKIWHTGLARHLLGLEELFMMGVSTTSAPQTSVMSNSEPLLATQCQGARDIFVQLPHKRRSLLHFVFSLN